MAKKNNFHGSLEIRGYADENCFDEFNSDFLSKSVILSDIEGGEFSIFNEDNLAKLCRSVVLIEIHDFLVDNGNLKLESLISRASKNFEVTRLTTTRRDPSQFKELEKFTDIDRWITVVEGRGPLMIWLLLSPRSAPKMNS